MSGSLVCLAALLSACGGGTGGSPGDAGNAATTPDPQTDPQPDLTGDAEALRPGAGTEFFPLNAGDQWVYRLSDESLIKFSVTGPERVGDVETTVVSRNVPGFPAFAQAHYAVVGRSLRQIPGADAGAAVQALGPLDVMRLPLIPGERFVQVDKTVDSGVDVDGDGRTDALEVRSVVTMQGYEVVRLDAGLFPRTAHLRTQIVQSIVRSSDNARSTTTATIDDWYAAGVGLVRSLGVYRQDDQVQRQDQRLAAYKVSGRRSEYLAPRVSGTEPAAGSLQGGGISVAVDFSEPVDGDSITPETVAISDAQGVPVAGALYTEGNRVTFQPNFMWPTGRYTVRLNGVRDLAGNPLRPYSWSFNVDGDAPTAVALTPANEANDVALDAVLRAQFSEALAPDSVAGSVRLVDASGAGVPITVTLADARTLSIRPQSPLQRGSFYNVLVGTSLTDLRGNAVARTPWRFRTDPGLYSYPVLVSPQFAPEAVAVGDVNGDGLDDVVMSTYFSFDPANDFKLVVYLQRPDGTLAEPVRYANASSYGCKAGSLAVADFDGDGRKDVAIAESGCGIELFIQQADGTLASGNWLPTTESHRVRAADLNGDGLADLVGMGADTNQVSVWYQVGGRISLPTVHALDHVGGGDLDVGDLNGDGRPDIVVTSPGGEPARSIGLLYQQPDGRYGAPAYLGVDGTWAARGVAIGDLNGDGRKDLAVTWGGAAPATLSVFHQRTDGTLAPMVSLASRDYPGAIEIADLDRDGRLDVVVAHDGWGSVGVYLQGAGGVLQDEQRFEATDGSANLNGLAVGDVNGDGRPDIVQAGVSVLYNRSRAAVAAMGARMDQGAAARPLQWWSGLAGRGTPPPPAAAKAGTR